MDRERLVALILEHPPRRSRPRRADVGAILRSRLLVRRAHSRPHLRAAAWASLVKRAQDRRRAG